MNASWMLNLYPQAWRERYEVEFRAMLDDHDAAPSEMLDILLGALDAHLRPQVRAQNAGHLSSPPVARSPRPQARAFVLAHASFFLLLNALMVIINVVFSSGTWWSPYVLWGTGMVLVLHAGLTYPWRDYFGLHLVLYAILNSGLIAINVAEGGGPWSIWPAVSLGVLLVTHGLLAFRLVLLFQAHVIATALASVELMVLPLLTDADVVQSAINTGILWVLVLAHWLVRFMGASLFTAHLATFAGVMTLLAISNAADDSGIWWVRYPLVVWGLLLGVHGVSQSTRATMAGGAWEAAMLQVLGDRARETPRQRRMRSLIFHAGLFGLGSVILLVLDLMEAPGQWWAMWPIGVWLTLLAVHLGWVLLPGRMVGVHLLAWLATSAGLIAIDAATAGGPWWQWPVVWWGVAVAAHAGSMLPVRTPYLGVHLAGGLALSGALLFTNMQTGSPTWWWYPVGVVIFTVIMHAGWILERSMGRGR